MTVHFKHEGAVTMSTMGPVKYKREIHGTCCQVEVMTLCGIRIVKYSTSARATKLGCFYAVCRNVGRSFCVQFSSTISKTALA